MRKRKRQAVKKLIQCAAVIAAGVLAIILFMLAIWYRGKNSEPVTDEQVAAQMQQAEPLVIETPEAATEGSIRVYDYDGCCIYSYYGKIRINSDGKDGKEIDVEALGYLEGYQEHNEEMEKLSDAEIEDAKEKAKQYNDSLSNTVVISDPFDPDAADDMSADYISALNLEKNGIMAYIEIPRIDVYEPVYHGTSEEVLAKGVGHLEGTSLPIGGESTHTVLSGHTGLPEAEIFTKLESVKEGDIFLIHVLNETLAYKVDQIKVVEPSETDDLKIVPGYDYATLVTCTPYGINSHRLLVRGIRTEYTQDVSDEAAGQAEEGPDGGGWKAMYEKAIIEGILFAVILVVLINVIVRKFGKKNKSEVAIYDEKEKKEKKPCKKAGKRRRRKSKRTER